MIRRSGLQKEVISTYRRALRVIRSKPVDSQTRFRTLIRWHFRRPQVQEEISPRNISLIEHLVRKCQRQIEMWENPGVKDVVLNGQMKSWEEGRRWQPKRPSRDSSK
ncbi:hypothetical protein M408DRAFT_80180 [Serendipita vermifera MAFF 305830]|uniref:Complex 1 LYR protein domain-containing protein n=1 Tax=Serendipita vermifera MAFF 305830 TaxID=933852 RepID=A0A0C3AAQ0_SERVB|nr:hypothetical protein M408DRAFT_80180 [Serendipita vermifera MAFF 305830]